MSQAFKNTSILVALENGSTLKLLSGVLKILQFASVDAAEDGGQAFRLFQEKNHDLVITEQHMQPYGGIYLVSKIRDAESGSPNVHAPVILNTGQSANMNVKELQDAGFTDLLLSPFSVDDVRSRLSYVLENHQQHSAPALPEPPVPPQAPPIESDTPEKESELVKSLLGHYIGHHEAVLQKLKFAQDATMQSIQEIRNVGKELENRDNTNLHEFTHFEKMWEEIIEMFLKGGMSEDDIFKIEDVITNIPQDIKKPHDRAPCRSFGHGFNL